MFHSKKGASFLLKNEIDYKIALCGIKSSIRKYHEMQKNAQTYFSKDLIERKKVSLKHLA
jgi:hypothetical protein